MWPLLIVNYVKLIELKRLLMYSKESCNNLANIIHRHGPFRLERPLHDLHSAVTGWPGRQGRDPGLTLTQCHNIRLWPHHCHKIATSDMFQCLMILCCLSHHVVIWPHLRAGPGSRHWPLWCLGAVNCYYWLSQPGPGPRSPAPWWGQQSTLKIFLLRTK